MTPLTTFPRTLSLTSMAFKPMVCLTLSETAIQCSSMIGVGAADITKLKANGYYTVAVGISDPSLHRDPF